MTTIFRSFVLNLTALTPGVLDGAVGELAHAAFYQTIQEADPALAQRMHDAQERAAFTLSPLFGYWRSPQDKLIHINTGQPGFLRVTLLDDELAGVFLHAMQRETFPRLRLGKVELGVTGALGAPGSHPWSGYTTLEELAALDRTLDRTPTHWTLEFASPTAIRWGEADNKTRRLERFPLPRLALAALRTRWDRLTGDTWGRAFEEWAERNLVVGRIWNWRTEAVRFQGQTYSGGVGRLEYQLLDGRSRANAVHCERLLRLAFYTGIGYKTTLGLGQVRLLDPEGGDEA
jgi:CRISPR-associated endoribonuclease Cas6